MRHRGIAIYRSHFPVRGQSSAAPSLTRASMRRSARIAMVAIVFALCSTLFAANPARGPRPISDAERAAVEFAAEYLARGPEAFLDKLAANSPLRSFRREDSLAEIEVRAGPPTGASWELMTVVPSLSDRLAVFAISFPSGADETLTMELVREKNEFRIANLRILAEPTPGAVVPQPTSTVAVEIPRDRTRVFVSIGLMGFLLCLFAIGLRRRSSALAFLSTVGALVVFVIGVAGAFKSDIRFAPATQKKSAVEGPRNEGLRSLLELRRAMTVGDQAGDSRVIDTSANDLTHRASRLWSAQLALQQLRSADVVAILGEFPQPSDIPLAEILRARLAFLQSKEADCVLAYERAINLGPGRDGLWFEAAEALMILGFEDRSKRYLERMAKTGSRESGLYYTLASIAASDDKLEDAESYLVRGWKLRPVERRALLGMPSLWALVRKRSVGGLLSLSAPLEPQVVPEGLSAKAIATPDGAESVVSGDYLRIRIGDAELGVPSGAPLAPQGTEVFDARTWALREDERAINDFPALLTVSKSAGIMTQPLMRRRIEKAAEALSNHHRWTDLVALTGGMQAQSENVPVDLMLMRGTALRRLKQDGEARRLVGELSRNPVLRRKSDPGELIEVGEMLAALGDYDPAIKLLQKAGTVREIPWIDDRIRQLLTDKRLSTSYSTERTEHFEVRYPQDVSRPFAQRIAEILEAELRRLRPTIPFDSFERVTVNIVWWQEFRSTYTGSDHILGLYDGKITLPFGGAPGFVPEVVAILTHELAHAMLAQATRDQAPRWFQEGLAQRVEMEQFSENALNMYDDDRLLALSLLDSVMGASPDPSMVEQGYIESHTYVRFIESECGPRAIHRLITAFREGATTEMAVSSTCSGDLADMERRFRDWGRSKVRLFENPPPVRYDGDISFLNGERVNQLADRDRLETRASEAGR